MKKLLLYTLVLLPPIFNLQASELMRFPYEEPENKSAFIMDVLAPKELGNMKLKHSHKGFSLSINDIEKDIPNYMVSKPLRQMSPEQLSAFLQSNYLTLKECSDGSFALEEHGRLHGGGLFSAVNGAIAGKWVGQAVVIVAGYTILLTATGVVTAVGGRQAGKEFFQHVQQHSIPNLWRASETISNVTGAAGAVVGIAVPGA